MRAKRDFGEESGAAKTRHLTKKEKKKQCDKSYTRAAICGIRGLSSLRWVSCMLVGGGPGSAGKRRGNLGSRGK